MRGLPIIAAALAALAFSSAYGQTTVFREVRPDVSVTKQGNTTRFEIADPDLAKKARVLEELWQVPGSENERVVRWIIANANDLQPVFFYELARRLWDLRRRDDALEWFAFALVRSSYDAARCSDETARETVGKLPSLAVHVASSMTTSPDPSFSTYAVSSTQQTSTGRWRTASAWSTAWCG